MYVGLVTPATFPHEAALIPARCPECGEHAGMPYMAGTSCEHDRISVGVRCRQCSHEWCFDMPRAKPRPDGRLPQRRA